MGFPLRAQGLFHPLHRHANAGAVQPLGPAAGDEARARVEAHGVEGHGSAQARATGGAGARLDRGEQRAPETLPLSGGVHEQRAQGAVAELELRDSGEPPAPLGDQGLEGADRVEEEVRRVAEVDRPPLRGVVVAAAPVPG